MMEHKVCWGVVGSGGIARRRTIPEGLAKARNAGLTAVFDTDAGANAEVAEQFGATAFRSLVELLESGIDAVYIATPAHCHAEQVRLAARAGKHILCEKPVARTSNEAQMIASEVQAAGVRFGTAFMMRFHSQHREAAGLIRQGRLGIPVFCRAQLSCWYPPIEGAWRQNPRTGGGGALIDMGGHLLDLLEDMIGPVARVSCFTRNQVHGYASEDGATVLLEFAGGALGMVDTFFCIPDESSKNVLELYGSAGSILAAGTLGQGPAGRMTAYLTSPGAGYDALQQRSSAGGVEIVPEAVNLYQAEIEEFSQAVLENREPRVGLDAGLRSQKVIEACYSSARAGCAIEIR